MCKTLILVLCSACCCSASIRVVKSVSLGGDKNFKPQKKNTSGQTTEEKSETKLQLVSQTPENNITDFNSKEIVLKFNRKIVVDIDKIFVSGGKGKDSFSFATSGEKLIITPRLLQKDTTYQINCTNAVKDFDKGFCDNNIIFSFSTGKEINKGCIRGKVLDLMTNNVVKDCLVTLYMSSEKQDNIVNSEKPLYFTRTNDKGEYTFEHLANGSYFLCAGTCERGSLLCDHKKNKYGFYKYDINVSDNEFTVDVDILENEMEKFKLLDRVIDDGKYSLKFNRPIKKIKSLTTNIKSQSITKALKTYVISEDHCSIVFNHSSFPMMLPEIDKIQCHMSLCDDFDTILDCDFDLAFAENKEAGKKEKYNLKVEHKDKFLTTNSCLDFRVISNKEIERITEDNIILYLKDKLDYRYVIDKNLYNITFSEDKHSIHVKSKQHISDLIKIIGSKIDLHQVVDINLELVIRENAIVLYNREETGERTFNFNFSKNFGQISGNVNASDMHVKIQLLGSDFKPVATIEDKNSFIFENIPEGKYKLRVLFWPKKQHVWSCGDINHKKLHDPVLFYKDDIDVMSNSDIKNINIAYMR